MASLTDLTYAQLQAHVAELENNIAAHNTEYAEVQQQSQITRQNEEKLDSDLEKIESEMMEMDEKYSRLESQKIVLEDKLEELEGNDRRETEKENKARQEREDGIKRKKDELDKLKNDMEVNESEQERLDLKKDDIAGELTTSQFEIMTLNERKVKIEERLEKMTNEVSDIKATIARHHGELDREISRIENQLDCYEKLFERGYDLLASEPCVGEMLLVFSTDHFKYGYYNRAHRVASDQDRDQDHLSNLTKKVNTLNYFQYLNALKDTMDDDVEQRCLMDECARIRREFLDMEINRKNQPTIALPEDSAENEEYRDYLEEEWKKVEDISPLLVQTLQCYHRGLLEDDSDRKSIYMAMAVKLWEFPIFVSIESNRCAVSDPIRSEFLRSSIEIHHQYLLEEECEYQVEEFETRVTFYENLDAVTNLLVNNQDKLGPGVAESFGNRLSEAITKLCAIPIQVSERAGTKTAEELKISEEEMSLMERKIRQIMLMNSPDKMDNGSHARLLEKAIGDKRQALSQELLDLDQRRKEVRARENREDMVKQLKSFIETRQSFIRQQIKTLKVDQKKAAQATKIHKEIDDAASDIVKSAREQLETRARAAAMRKFSTKKKGK